MRVENDMEIRDILASTRTIAVVGASDKPWRDSNDIMRYLLSCNYNVIPVNPGHRTILEKRCYPSLRDIPEHVDMVDVFRRPEAVPAIVEDALAIKAGTLWLQLGVIHEAAAAKAERGGLNVIMDRCIAVDHRRLIAYAKR